MFGVGLSQAQFEASTAVHNTPPDGAVACGMCLELEARMSLWDCELNAPLSRCTPGAEPGAACTNDWHTHKVLAMVVDQCEDGWTLFDGATGAPKGNCATGHLDLDVYPLNGDLAFLDVASLTWRAVDCPTDGIDIQFAFSTSASNEYYFAFQVWDSRSPLTTVEVLQVTTPGMSLEQATWAELEFKAQVCGLCVCVFLERATTLVQLSLALN